MREVSMKYLFKAFVCIGLCPLVICLLAGCGNPMKEGYYHHADVSGEIITYTVMPRMEGSTGSVIGTVLTGGMKISTIVASIPSGEIFVDYENYFKLFFSDDGTQVLKEVRQPTPYGMKDVHLKMCNTNDDSVVWQSALAFDNRMTQPVRAIWDKAGDRLLLGFINISEMQTPRSEMPGGNTNKDNGEGESRMVIVLRLSDGQELARIKLRITSTARWDMYLRFMDYGGGRIFVASKHDPLAEKQDNSGDKMSIYAIEPITKEVKCFDLGDNAPGFNSSFYVTEAGDKIFFESEGKQFHERIFELDTNSGESRVLSEGADQGESCRLEDITPDGSKLCLMRTSYSRESGSTITNPAVLDVASGEVRILESSLPDNKLGFYECAITSSGKYIIGFTIDSDIWVYDVEKGTGKVLISQDKKTMIFNPQIPGQGNEGLF